jgi:iron complex outermembrane receptor protein
VKAEFNWRITPDLNITYIGSLREYEKDINTVFTLFQQPLRQGVLGDFDQTSHEIRLAFHRGPLQLQGGVYAFDEDVTFQGPTDFGYLSPFIAPVFGIRTPTQTFYRTLVRNTDSRSRAVFAQGVYALSDELRLTAGIRYSDDRKHRDGYSQASLGVVYNPTTDLRTLDAGTSESDQVTWRLGLDYDLGETGLLFASAATGYKAGGFNDGCAPGVTGSRGLTCTQPRAASEFYYEPETITSYEGGYKVHLADRGLALQLNGFYYDYKDLQLLSLDPRPGGTAFYLNAPKAKVWGGELEGLWSLGERHSLQGALTHTHAAFGNYRPLGAAGVSFKGRRLERAPEFTVSLRYTYRQPLFGGELAASAGTRLSSTYYLHDYANGVSFRQTAFTKSDLNLTFTAPRERWSASAFVRNIENEVEVTSVQSGSSVPTPGGPLLLPGYATGGEPRTYGLRFTVKVGQ